VGAANPRTVVVLNTPGAVLMPWLDELAAVVQAWYPGERFGAALAAVLFGDAEPGGRLPLTFPRSRRDLPGGDHGPETVPTELDYDADGGIGYRAPGVREHGALFAFGHGLGYAPTTCTVTGVDLLGEELGMSLSIANLGDRDTVHVVQCYAEVAGEAVELVHVQRVPVAAGQVVETSATIGATAFARWDAESSRRVSVEGPHTLRIATSSTDPGTSIDVTIVGGRFQSVNGP
jgi:beta-glucosidase